MTNLSRLYVHLHFHWVEENVGLKGEKKVDVRGEWMVLRMEGRGRYGCNARARS